MCLIVAHFNGNQHLFDCIRLSARLNSRQTFRQICPLKQVVSHKFRLPGIRAPHFMGS